MLRRAAGLRRGRVRRGAVRLDHGDQAEIAAELRRGRWTVGRLHLAKHVHEVDEVGAAPPCLGIHRHAKIDQVVPNDVEMLWKFELAQPVHELAPVEETLYAMRPTIGREGREWEGAWGRFQHIKLVAHAGYRSTASCNPKEAATLLH